MKALKFLFLSTFLFAACGKSEPAKNPDPNHTHADFAVWIEGKPLDFARNEFMSGSSKDAEHKNALSPHLHLHDTNGDVIHRHKPGLTLTEFFASMPGMRYQNNEFKFLDCMTCQQAAGSYAVKLYVNGEEEPLGSLYVFADSDKLLITDTTEPVELRKQIRMMSDDACLYSRLCPERGDPPTESCVADPEVPCK